MKILITGVAGFIGFHLVNKLLKETDWQIVGFDNINDYYEVNLKFARLKETGIDRDIIEKAEKDYSIDPLIQSSINPHYRFIKLDLTDKEKLLKLFEQERFDYVVNLAAQTGVRYSLENPQAYISSNINGFFNLLEGCRLFPVKHLVFASSSSVYGNNKKTPFSESDRVDQPISLYAATKKSNELMAYTYSHLYNLPVTGLRFFTVYGPWGRPDMAYFKFTKAILNDEPINIYNNGDMTRDFTYIDDIVEGVKRVIKHIPNGGGKINDFDTSYSFAPYKVYNIGNSSPVQLNDFISLVEKELGKKAKRNYLPIQPGDVKETNSDVTELLKDVSYIPQFKILNGIPKFIDWYKQYYASN